MNDIKEITALHCGVMQWELQEWIIECADISMATNNPDNNYMICNVVKDKYPKVIEMYFEYMEKEYGTDREEWVRTFHDGSEHIKDDLTSYIYNYGGEISKELGETFPDGDDV